MKTPPRAGFFSRLLPEFVSRRAFIEGPGADPTKVQRTSFPTTQSSRIVTARQAIPPQPRTAMTPRRRLALLTDDRRLGSCERKEALFHASDPSQGD
jgi:hypothetical protein